MKGRYSGGCQCGRVRYVLDGEITRLNICHCRDCQTLHGAPMQWAAIFRKADVRFNAGVQHLRFYHSAHDKRERLLPCKVSCGLCGAPIADEGRNMWLAFPTLFDFGEPPDVPESFKPTCHIFYSMRVIDFDDSLPKWSGHKDKSPRL